MGFEAPQEVGLIEKASKIALKHGVVFNSQQRIFKGEEYAVLKATNELKKWSDARDSRRYRETRSSY